ncbi:MAG: phytoene desaturase family protein [bacterium]|nr:phytoene desaturase family protein [bacterium]
MATINIIGSGYSGLSAACFAAKKGNTVHVFEKNASIGGRSRYFKEQEFLFDMGPSWYWMPDVFENFFGQFGKSPSDYYTLVKTDPAFQVFFSGSSPLKVPNELEGIYQLFESIEPGSAQQLKKFMKEGGLKYAIAMDQLIYKPALSWSEYATFNVVKGVFKTHIFKSMSSYVRSFFKDERLIALMEFPVLFLGAMPQQIPALYSLMNYAAFQMGTWYPMGGMYKVVEGMADLAKSLGVEIHTHTEVQKILTAHHKVQELATTRGIYRADATIATGDYHHIEQHLLDEEHRNYKESYWNERTMAPTSLIFYLGTTKKIDKLVHHNLFFDADFKQHAADIYKEPRWPEDPLFYVCAPSKTDPAVAPEGHENLFVLIPLAAGINDTPELRELYFDKIMTRMEKTCGHSIRDSIVVKRSYCVSDFEKDYNAYKGNAYGLANTLMQTAVLKPSMQNKHLKNLFYAGQLTVPGPGVPPALISGQIAAEQTQKYLKKTNQSVINA